MLSATVCHDVSSAALESSIAVLYSGGLDSSILLVDLLGQAQRVHPLYIACGFAWQRQELLAAKRFLRAIATPRLEPLVVLDLPLADLYGDHWSITGRQVPTASDPDECVYLPGHNPLLLIKADLWCRMHGVPRLALGALASNPFADATDAFFAPFTQALDQAMPGHVELVRPLSDRHKDAVMRSGRAAPLHHTFSCLSPQNDLHCGVCNKCAERRRAFADVRLPDPTTYACAAPPLSRAADTLWSCAPDESR